MVPPARTLGGALLTIAMSAVAVGAPLSTLVTADAELFALDGSGLDDATWALLTMLVPSGALAATRTTSLTDRSVPAAVSPGQSHRTDPPDGDGVEVQVPPGLGEAETNAVPGGTASVIDTSLAAPGPRLVARSR